METRTEQMGPRLTQGLPSKENRTEGTHITLLTYGPRRVEERIKEGMENDLRMERSHEGCEENSGA